MHKAEYLDSLQGFITHDSHRSHLRIPGGTSPSFIPFYTILASLRIMPGGINVPLDVLLAWPAPDYNNPVTKPKYVLIFSCVIGPISIVLLCVRLWVRIHMQHNAGWDDWLMLAAAVSIPGLL